MSKQSQSDVLGEIERLEGELQRIARELDSLRKRVDGPTRTGRTQAFAGVAGSLPPPSSVTPAAPPSGRAPQPQPPSSRPRPSPTIPPKTGTRPISERSTADTAPAQVAASAGSGRRAAGPAVGLEHEPSSPPPRGRESPAPREAGRYEFVQESKPRSSTRR